MPQSSPPHLYELARAAGVARHWRAVDGQDHVVSDDALMAILGALGHAASSKGQIRSSLSALAESQQSQPPMVVTEVGLPTPLQTLATSAEATGEDGVTLRFAITDGMLAPLAQPGYYDLAFRGQTTKLAVAPAQCRLPARRGWGASLDRKSVV